MVLRKKRRTEPKNKFRGRKNVDVTKTQKLPDQQVFTQPKMRIVTVGGCEEVGRNMTVFEYGNDIVIVDMGLQFPEEDMPGIDYIVPNISYLKGKEDNIRGVIITHGHYDHIGGIPILIPRLGNPTIYTTKMAKGIIEKRQEDYQEKLKIQEIAAGEKFRLGAFEIETVHINHNIPGSIAVAIKTPVGIFLHTGDYKFDHSPSTEPPADLRALARLGTEGITALLADSTSTDHEGFQLSELEIGKNLEQVVQNANGRIIIATFASLISRVKQIIEIAEKHGRFVAIDGRSMRTNVEIAYRLGYIKFRKGTLISIKDSNKLPNNKVMIVATGAQGEDRAVLARIANKEHKEIGIEKDDLVVFSSSIVQGNERSVAYLVDTLMKQGAKVLNYKMLDIHAGGHARAEDAKILIRLTNPKFFIPIQQHFHVLKAHADIAESLGILVQNIFIPENGSIFEFEKNSRGEVIAKRNPKKAPSDYIMVDGLGVGDVSNVVLRDRQMLAEDGIFVAILTVDKQGELTCNPHIISRGFVYLDENKQLLADTRDKIREVLKTRDRKVSLNSTYIKGKIRNEVGQFLYQKTERRPMVLPVIIEV